MRGEDLARLRRLGTRYGRVITVLFEPSCWDAGAAPPPRSHLGQAVRVSATHPFPVAWSAHLAPAPGRGRVVAATAGPTSDTAGATAEVPTP